MKTLSRSLHSPERIKQTSTFRAKTLCWEVSLKSSFETSKFCFTFQVVKGPIPIPCTSMKYDINTDFSLQS